MLTAQEACEISKGNRESSVEHELKQIESVILGATSRGKTKAYFYDKISTMAKSKLEELGYKVDIQYTQRDGYSVNISWGNGCN